MLKYLAGRVALVTGSTGGIGEGVARCLAQRGANIVLNGFGDDRMIQNMLKSFKSEYNVDAVYIGGDLSDPKDVKALYDGSVKSFPGGIDILVNNAGFQHVSPLEAFPLDTWNKMISLMLTAPFQLTQFSVGNMKAKGWGRIINIASAHGLVASPFKSAYVTIKHGMMGFTKVKAILEITWDEKTVGLEVAGSGVTCNAVCPGYVETPLFVKQAEDRSRAQGISVEDAKKAFDSIHRPSLWKILKIYGFPAKYINIIEAFYTNSSCSVRTESGNIEWFPVETGVKQKQILAVHASGQPVKVSEVAEIVAFLCTNSASQMTGSSLVVDGGWTAR